MLSDVPSASHLLLEAWNFVKCVACTLWSVNSITCNNEKAAEEAEGQPEVLHLLHSEKVSVNLRRAAGEQRSLVQNHSVNFYFYLNFKKTHNPINWEAVPFLTLILRHILGLPTFQPLIVAVPVTATWCAGTTGRDNLDPQTVKGFTCWFVLNRLLSKAGHGGCFSVALRHFWLLFFLKGNNILPPSLSYIQMQSWSKHWNLLLVILMVR